MYPEAKMKLVIDKTSIEIFFNDGEKVLTEIFFPNEHFSN
jgi:levanase/fructan beta-fructosidase